MIEKRPKSSNRRIRNETIWIVFHFYLLQKLNRLNKQKEAGDGLN